MPTGIYDGAELRIASKGDAGVFRGPAGDLYLNVNVTPDKRFSRREHDLVAHLNLTYPQLVLGAQVEITLLDDTKQIIRVPKGCKVGEEIVTPGKGFARLGSMGKGNLVIKTQCDIPKKLSREAKESLLAYAEILGNEGSGSQGGISGFFKRFLG